jgi:hypothetical protein
VAFFVVGTLYGLYRYVQEVRKPVDEVDVTQISE